MPPAMETKPVRRGVVLRLIQGNAASVALFVLQTVKVLSLGANAKKTKQLVVGICAFVTDTSRKLCVFNDAFILGASLFSIRSTTIFKFKEAYGV
jgi:hypothetical protein